MLAFSRISLLAVALLAATSGYAQSSTEAPEPPLPPEFSQHSELELKWRGLASLYPGMVLTETPPAFTPHTPREPLVAELPDGVTYLRVYDLPLAMPALEEHAGKTRLVLDLRYQQSQEPEAFTALIENTRPKHPLIVLVNHRTAGKLEVALENLQSEGKILAVGVPTAGETGSYRPVPGLDGFYVIDTQHLSHTGKSLLGTGFTPRIVVDTAPEEDYLGYQLVERGTPVEQVLQIEYEAEVTEDGEEPEDDTEPADPILQRALDVIVALQVLGKLPPS